MSSMAGQGNGRPLAEVGLSSLGDHKMRSVVCSPPAWGTPQWHQVGGPRLERRGPQGKGPGRNQSWTIIFFSFFFFLKNGSHSLLCALFFVTGSFSSASEHTQFSLFFKSELSLALFPPVVLCLSFPFVDLLATVL